MLFSTTFRPKLGSKLGAISFRLGFWLAIIQFQKYTAKLSLPAWSLDPSLGLKVVPKNLSAFGYGVRAGNGFHSP